MTPATSTTACGPPLPAQQNREDDELERKLTTIERQQHKYAASGVSKVPVTPKVRADGGGLGDGDGDGSCGYGCGCGKFRWLAAWQVSPVPATTHVYPAPTLHRVPVFTLLPSLPRSLAPSLPCSLALSHIYLAPSSLSLSVYLSPSLSLRVSLLPSPRSPLSRHRLPYRTLPGQG